MNNTMSMSPEFEKQKNVQASAITGGISGALLLLFILVKWAIPVNSPPPVSETIEINLGSSNDGMGSDQPQLPGDPAPAQQTAYSPPQPVQSHEEASKDIPDDNSNDATPVIKPTVTKPDAKKINTETKVVKTTNINPAPPVVTPPRQKAVLGHTIGGNGNGGNGADTYKPGTGEGTTGKPGDQGVVGGNPNGTQYNGTPKNLGIRVVNIPAQSFQDDFNESGKIALDIVVDENGKLVSASYQINGSTLAKSSKQYTIALTRAREINYPKYDGGFKQKLTLNFSVK